MRGRFGPSTVEGLTCAIQVLVQRCRTEGESVRAFSLLALWASSALAIPGAGVSWDVIQTDPVPVSCAEIPGGPWCRSEGVIHAPVADVVQALKNMRYNAAAFESVVRIDVVEDEVLRVVLDYPSPLSDRDYVAQYSYRREGNAHVFAWKPANAKYPVEEDIVRLPLFAGEWRLEQRGARTWVRYTWHAQINGSFPSFGYKTAWKKAGHEALRDLAQTQKAKLTIR